MIIFVVLGVVFGVGIIIFVHKFQFGKEWAQQKLKIDEYSPDDQQIEEKTVIENQQELEKSEKFRQRISERKKELFKNLSDGEQKLLNEYMQEQLSKSPEQLQKEAKEYEDRKLDYFLYALVLFLAICFFHYYMGGFENIIDAIHIFFGGK